MLGFWLNAATALMYALMYAVVYAIEMGIINEKKNCKVKSQRGKEVSLSSGELWRCWPLQEDGGIGILLQPPLRNWRAGKV